VFREAYRLLKPGGRLAISDVVATGEIPAEMRSQAALFMGCIAGAEPVDRLRTWMQAAGFV
jgi:predicted methyltransferase